MRATLCASLLILLPTCQVDKLTNTPPPVAKLSLAPALVLDSAAVGSTRMGGDSLLVQNTGQGTLSWSARLARGDSWLAFTSATTGTAPARLRLAFDPRTLAPGVYRDTVVVDAENAVGSPGRVPVAFTVHPCMPSDITPDALLADSLTTRDCSAPHRAPPNSFARVFRFTAQAGDSVAVFMSSTAVDAYVLLDTSLAASAPPLAQNDTCGSAPGLDACLPNQRLPIAGTYLIEATAGAAQTGPFTLRVTRPRSPTGLAQFQSDGITPIPNGGTATSPSVVFKATVADPGLGSQLRLEVEVQPIGAVFTNVASGSGNAVANGSVATAAVAGLSGNTGYHWQARAVDQSGRAGLWGSFGPNAETDPDFRLPGAATQIAANGGDNQTVTAGTNVPIPPSVIVRDAGGHPVPGVAVTFAVASGGGSLTSPTQTTDASGIASVGSWTLGTVAGPNTLAATSGTLTGSPVTFTATGTAGNPGSIAANGGNNQTATVNTAVTTPPSVIVKDANGNAVSGVSVGFAVASGGGSITGPTAVTNANGIATVGSWTLGTAAGTNTLTATTPGLVGNPVTFTATGVAGAPSAGRSLISAAPTTITASNGASTARITVTVIDQFGNAVSGATVGLTATPPTGNTLTQPVGTTDASGQATGTLSSTKAETKTVTATVNGTTVVTPTATVTVNPGPAATVAINAGNNQTVTAGSTVPIAPAVLVTDANGNPVAGVAVAFAVASGGGGITAASQLTNTNGIATVGSWTLGTAAGPNTLTATSGSLVGSPLTFTATGTAGNAGSIAVNAGNNQTATVNTAVATPPSVIVKDVNGNAVAGVSVTFATTSRGGSVTGASQTTNANGIATVGSWILGTTAGPDTMTATSTGVNGSPVTFIATGTADVPSASRSSVSAAPPTIAASSGTVAATITVTALDQFGNPVPGKAVGLSASPTTGNTLTQPAAVTDVNGVATGTLSSTKAETKTVLATIGGVAITQQPTVTVSPAAPNNLNFVGQPPASTTAGATMTPPVQVEILDAFSNRVTTATNGVTLAIGANPGGGTLTGGTPAVAAVSGVATFSGLSIDKAGTGYTLTASSTNLAGQVSSTFNIINGAAAAVALNGGNAQTDTIGASLATPYSVKVTDANNNPVGGITVTWAVTSGGGSITPSSVTSPTGIATATRILGTTAGPQGSTATITGLAGSPVSFVATATHGNATTIASNAGNSQTDTIGATLATPYAVLVTDWGANPVGGVTVAWAAAGGGTITASSLTAATGIATATRVLGTAAGTQGASATVAGLSGSPVSFTATATHGAATTIAKNGGDAQAGPVNSTLPVAYTVLVTDRGGNPVNGTTVTWAVTGGGSITPSSVTAPTGIASATRVLGPTAGTQGATATVAGLIGSPVSFTATATAGGATKLVITTQPAVTGTSGAALSTQPVVQLRDANDNNVAQAGTVVTATVATGPAGATLANPMATTAANGAATFSGLAISGSVGSYRLQMASGTHTPDTTVAIALSAGTATTLVLTTQPSASVQNAIAFPQQPVVQLQDASGNNVAQAGVGVTPAIASGGGSLSPTAAILTNASGAAVFSGLAITGTTGARTLTFTSGSLTAVTSAAVTVTAGTATQIAVNSGNNQVATAGTVVGTPPAVIVRDVSGNPVASVAVTFAVPGTSNGAVTGPSQSTDVNGIATVGSWTLSTTPKPDTMTATSTGLVGSPVTFVDTAKVGAAAHIAKFSGDIVGPVNSTTLHDVLLTDANNNPVPGVTVTWAAQGGGMVSPATSVSDAGGHAQATRTLGITPGSETTTATAPLTGGPTTVTFNITAQVGGASQMAVNGGDAQTDTVGKTLPAPISVVVKDAFSNPVSNVAITWSILHGGGSLNPATSVTNSSGIASTSWTLGTVTSSSDNTQFAQASGVASPVRFTATTVPGAVDAAQTSVTATSPITAGGAASSITVTARDQYGNLIAGKGVTLSATGTSNTVTNPAAPTDVNGMATGSLTSTKAETKTVTAAVGTLTIAQRANVTVNPASADNLNFVVQPPASTTAGAVMTPAVQVEVRDAFGNRVTTATNGVTLVIGANAGGGTLTGGTPAVAAVNGVATFSGLSIDKVGSGYTLNAASTSLTGQTSTAFAITAGAASSIAANGGNGQSATAGSAVAIPPSVIVKDANGNPVAGVAVTFAVASGGGTVAPTTPVATGANGIATVTSWTLGTTAGTNTLTATSGTLSGSPVTFTATGTPGTATTLVFSVQPTNTVAGASITPAVQVTALDAQSNPATGFTGTVTVAIGTNPGGGTLSGTATGAAVSGVATFSNLSIDKVGTGYTLTASATGPTGATSSGFDITPGAAVSIAVNAGDNQSAPVSSAVPIPPSVIVRDQFGNPVAGISVTFVVGLGAGTVSPSTPVTTGADGIAAVTSWILGPLAGPNTLTATAAAVLGGNPITFTATGT
ncbi:MAG TPA: Ig-like domain-containing protein [Gemmatimonadales bacterium]|nr:Ig-like domain-containing protein [Gemmatimonadales bacterium]